MLNRYFASWSCQMKAPSLWPTACSSACPAAWCARSWTSWSWRRCGRPRAGGRSFFRSKSADPISWQYNWARWMDQLYFCNCQKFCFFNDSCKILNISGAMAVQVVGTQGYPSDTFHWHFARLHWSSWRMLASLVSTRSWDPFLWDQNGPLWHRPENCLTRTRSLSSWSCWNLLACSSSFHTSSLTGWSCWSLDENVQDGGHH